jgi:hypothetical protein
MLREANSIPGLQEPSADRNTDAEATTPKGSTRGNKALT